MTTILQNAREINKGTNKENNILSRHNILRRINKNFPKQSTFQKSLFVMKKQLEEGNNKKSSGPQNQQTLPWGQLPGFFQTCKKSRPVKRDLNSPCMSKQN